MCHVISSIFEDTDTDLVEDHGRRKGNLYPRWFSSFIVKATTHFI